MLPGQEFRFSKEIANNARDDLKSLEGASGILCFLIKVNDLYPIVTLLAIANERISEKNKIKNVYLISFLQIKKNIIKFYVFCIYFVNSLLEKQIPALVIPASYVLRERAC